MSNEYNLAASLALQAHRRPEALALQAGGETVTYGELAKRVMSLSGQLSENCRTRRVGILGTRSVPAYVGILAACWAGSAYVPLNLKWPPSRLVALLDQLELDALVVDDNGARLLTPEILAHSPNLVVVPAAVGIEPVRPGQRVLATGSIGDAGLPEPAAVSADDIGYIMFTSGTTGLPKGVMVSAGSVAHYLVQSEGWTRYGPEDRIGESCDLTFDLSGHNLFLSLRAGASLHVMSQLEMLAPARFIRSRELTAWMSVPTIIALMQQNGALKPGLFPSLRLSIFCGEPLPVSSAQAWAEATPNGIVENTYGPTEATIMVLRQTLTSPPVVTEGRDIVAIGIPYEAMKAAILDPLRQPVADGEVGEIALAGPQLAIGYFGQPELTVERFPTIRGERWYMTGDLGRVDAAGVFHHLGRVDNQIKLKGNRVELEEIDAHLRRAAGTELVATVAWPVAYGSAEGLVGFVCGGHGDVEDIRQELARHLPRYLLPSRIILRDEMPRNTAGKLDRGALARMLAEEQGEQRSESSDIRVQTRTTGKAKQNERT